MRRSSDSLSEDEEANELTVNHYGCEFTSMADRDRRAPRPRSQSSSQSSFPLREVIEHLAELRVTNDVTAKPVLESPNLEGIAQYMKEQNVKNVICMCGAGISVNAGIPDFRSPGTGLFSRLEEMGLSTPEEVFSIDFFRTDPKPFYTLAKVPHLQHRQGQTVWQELKPGKFRPTTAHAFMKLLQDEGRLLRCYTQNIDSLESQAGLLPEKLVAAHGNFDSARCIDCGSEADREVLLQHVDEGRVMLCEKCEGTVKPDIVFYGESLPRRFFECVSSDFDRCDLLIVMGSSLVVRPFCLVVDQVPETTPRLLINKEWARGGYGVAGSGLRRKDPTGRDVFFQGDCDEGVSRLADLMDWTAKLAALAPT